MEVRGEGEVPLCTADGIPRTPQRDGLPRVPDVFHAQFEADAADYASQLSATAGDAALIGYFLMNEPSWGFSTELPAEGMLYNTPVCETRMELVRWLKAKYAGDEALAAAWRLSASLPTKVARGKWQGAFTEGGRKRSSRVQCADGGAVFPGNFKSLPQGGSKPLEPWYALGGRAARAWGVEGMKSLDVFSLNCYRQKLPRETAREIAQSLNMPVLVGEWHFGALDVGLPASGIGHVKNQADRGRAYRVYLEDAASDPDCVGAHWFTLYDESALGRYDGENYNIGFLDICNRPYEEIGQAAITSHERLYEVAAGTVEPFADAPEYLPMVFM